MKNKKNTIIKAITIIILVLFCINDTANAQQAGSQRTALQRHDLSVQGREVIQIRVDIAPGLVYPKHTHPGEEMVYVLEGLLEYRVEGNQPVILKAGDVLFIAAGKTHSVKNVGKGKGSELATYIVEKGKPLISMAARDHQ